MLRERTTMEELKRVCEAEGINIIGREDDIDIAVYYGSLGVVIVGGGATAETIRGILKDIHK